MSRVQHSVSGVDYQSQVYVCHCGLAFASATVTLSISLQGIMVAHEVLFSVRSLRTFFVFWSMKVR